ISAFISVLDSQPAYSEEGCHTKYADIMFALDGSHSIGIDNFKIMENFTKNIINDLPIGKQNVRVGLLTFDSDVRNEFNLNEYFTKKEIFRAIKNIHYYSKGTMTNSALDYLREKSFTEKAGDRKNIQNIAIVMTDGVSLNPYATKAAARKLRATGTMIFVVGIKDYDKREINGIASKPSSKFTYPVSGFQALNGIVESLVSKTCLYVPCSSGPCKNGASCINKGENYLCKCPQGYKGKDCSIVDRCSSNPCKHGGECSNKGDNYVCSCVLGYRGNDCSIVDPCSSNPCKYGGECRNKEDKYVCSCVPGYRGNDCSIVDPCDSSPCKHGGHCTNNGSNYNCNCLLGYRGDDCAIG
ncbi:adhesive plaque matrix protein 2-like, partial, partial [Argonauta hians]